MSKAKVKALLQGMDKAEIIKVVMAQIVVACIKIWDMQRLSLHREYKQQ